MTICDFAGWACRFYDHGLDEEYRKSLCENQDVYEIHNGEKIICQNREGLLSNSNTFKINFNEKRGDYEINPFILEMAKDGTKKTEITYKGNLSWTMINKKIKRLISAGLLTYSNKNKLYTTTDSGLEYLKCYYSSRRILAGFKGVEEGINLNPRIREKLIEKIKKLKRRDSFEILAFALELTSIPISKTRIMHDNYMEFGQLNKFLDFLIKFELLEKEEDNRYKSTEPGKQFVDMVLYMFFLSLPGNHELKQNDYIVRVA